MAAILRMLFSIHRDSKQVPEVPGLGDFYAGFLADIRETIKDSEQPEEGGIRKKQTWQEQKRILLEVAQYQAAAHQAEQRRQARARRRS